MPRVEEKRFARLCSPHKRSIDLSVSQPEAKKGGQQGDLLQVISKAPRQRPRSEARALSAKLLASPQHSLRPVTPTALTSLLQSWKMSLVRIRQEESTIVCFLMLLWQVAGDESNDTWGSGQEYIDGPKQSTQKDPRPSL